jgi:hypothetical protein
MGSALALSRLYRPRDATATVLHQVVREELPRLVELAEAGETSLPAFVQGELEAFLACGDPAHGFTQLKCPRCGHERFLPFSCKTRTICPSCAGRRMNETTAHLIDHVISDIAIRHWSLTFPPPLRCLFAYDAALASQVINIFVRTLFNWQRRVAKRELELSRCDQAVPAGITVIHRVGSAINLNFHLHSAIADGVFVRAHAESRPVFHALPAPEKGDIWQLGWEICVTTTRLLQRIGRYCDSDPTQMDTLLRDSPLLAACYAASQQLLTAMGSRRGQGVQRFGEYGDGDPEEGDHGGCGPAHGFNLRTGMRASAHDEKGRERILQYILRPPMATKRLTRGKDGSVIYWLRQPWKDGTKCFIYEPLDFLAKLLPLVPPPRVNQIRYHGAWAPHAAIRPEIVRQTRNDEGVGCNNQLPLRFPIPAQPTRGGACHSPRHGAHPPDRSGSAGAPGQAGRAHRDCRGGGRYPSGGRASKLKWAELSKRTFGVEVMRCEHCGYAPVEVVRVVESLFVA